MSAVQGLLRFDRCLQAWDSQLAPQLVPSPVLAEAAPIIESTDYKMLLLMEVG